MNIRQRLIAAVIAVVGSVPLILIGSAGAASARTLPPGVGARIVDAYDSAFASSDTAFNAARTQYADNPVVVSVLNSSQRAVVAQLDASLAAVKAALNAAFDG